MRAHSFQHVEFEALGLIEPALKARGYDITCTRWYLNEQPPVLADIDCLVIMGGPMSVHDSAVYPWLKDELSYLQQALEANKPILGICLGAQLIAQALNAAVYPGAHKEIGWWPIEAVPNTRDGVFQLPDQHSVFHWHGETFDVPEQAVLLAKSQGCAHQAFQYGGKVIGLQFHLETTPESAGELMRHCPQDLAPSKYVQSEQAIAQTDEACYEANQKVLESLLDYLLGE